MDYLRISDLHRSERFKLKEHAPSVIESLSKIFKKAIIKDIVFRGNYLEVSLDVNGVILTSHRSLERRPIHVGDEMNVIIFRLIAFDNEKAYLLRNEALMKIDKNAATSAAYTYGDDGYFVI